jgi:hypothetical protein
MINIEDYVERQMKRRGIEIAYARMIPVVVRRITSSDGTLISDSITYEAYNQYWFLVNAFELPIGTRITSDTNVMLIETHSDDLIEEFWGKITLQLPAGFAGTMCQALFYQVLPK